MLLLVLITSILIFNLLFVSCIECLLKLILSLTWLPWTEFNVKYLQQNGWDYPILLKSTEGTGLKYATYIYILLCILSITIKNVTPCINFFNTHPNILHFWKNIRYIVRPYKYHFAFLHLFFYPTLHHILDILISWIYLCDIQLNLDNFRSLTWYLCVGTVRIYTRTSMLDQLPSFSYLWTIIMDYYYNYY